MGYAQYSELDSSGVAWLQDKPLHWRVKRLKFSVDLINIKVSVEESSLPYLGLEHIESWTGRKIDGEISNSEGVASSYLAGDVLFGKLRPYLAKVHLAQQNGLISSEALVVRSKAELHAEFLKYYMLSRDFINIVDSSTYGSKMPRASWNFIGNLPVLLPEIEEQQTIAHFLDFKTAQIDALIAKQKALLDKLAEKRTALISHAVTKGLDPSAPMKDSKVEWLGSVPSHWKRGVKLNYMAAQQRHSFVNGPFGSDLLSSELTDDGVPVIYSGDVKPNRFFRKSSSYVTEEKAEQLNFCRVDPGDLLLAKVGDPPGDAAIYPEDAPSGIVTQDVVRIKLNDEIADSQYLTLLFNSKYGRFVIRTVSVEATRGRFSLGDFKSLRFVMPPLNEQRQIAGALISQIRPILDQEDKVLEVIAKLQEYRSALITNAVTGKIDVRGFQIPQPAQGMA
ncbi:MAG: restriction endonuclease subunit S [Proteobacteria bacterium]|nr:restriction endonuclease subunit S [Pseudomonadota bacterium]MBU4296565.1 restriction endonuclease subunit S [Pseudomonadota bacterium]MCG2748817.1 restriction endonuclease subunit S [Desulfobulbaceae bacterium]